MTGPTGEPQRIGPAISFRARLTIGLVAGALLPLAGFGLVLIAAQVVTSGAADPTLVRVIVFVLAAALVVTVVFAYLLAANLTAPLRAISRAVERVSAGDLSARVEVAGEDELARLVESHNRLAAKLERRNVELGRILVAIGRTSPRDGLDRLVAEATASARTAFDMIDAWLHLGDPLDVPEEEVVPGESRPVRAILALPDERLGVLTGRLPATRTWDAADQDLLELYASEVAVAIRNVQLFGQVEEQARRLRELDAAKDDFLRGISHNLQTPLTSIRAYAEAVATERPDRRLAIIVEQSERLHRIVRQLLAVSRLEAGTLRPRTEVLGLGARVRRAWEALGVPDVPFELSDSTDGWLAIADPDQLDQVLWALLDNAVRHGRGTPVEVVLGARPEEGRVTATIRDAGPGVPEVDRERVFERYGRSAGSAQVEGTGLGLYVSRLLCRAMGGDLVLEAGGLASSGPGGAFTVLLPGEAPTTEP